MIIYHIEEAYCDECGTYVPVYPCLALEQYQRGEYILAQACCYLHGYIGFVEALFKSGNPKDYPVPTKPQPEISHKMSKDFEGPLWQ
jgi:hypothetical protein